MFRERDLALSLNNKPSECSVVGVLTSTMSTRKMLCGKRGCFNEVKAKGII